MTSAPALRLRPATADDADLLLRWRNDEDAVRTSRSGRRVDDGEHRAWFTRRLGERAPRLWVAERGAAPVGSVRIDLQDGVGLVSIVVDPARRGHGEGTAMLAALLAEVQGDADVRELVAEVASENAASIKAFVRSGFVAAGAVDDRFDRYTWTPDRGRTGSPA